MLNFNGSRNRQSLRPFFSVVALLPADVCELRRHGTTHMGVALFQQTLHRVGSAPEDTGDADVAQTLLVEVEHVQLDAQRVAALAVRPQLVQLDGVLKGDGREVVETLFPEEGEFLAQLVVVREVHLQHVGEVCVFKPRRGEEDGQFVDYVVGQAGVAVIRAGEPFLLAGLVGLLGQKSKVSLDIPRPRAGCS